MKNESMAISKMSNEALDSVEELHRETNYIPTYLRGSEEELVNFSLLPKKERRAHLDLINELQKDTNYKFRLGEMSKIKELVETLRSFLRFNYEFDISKPSGFPKRVMDITKAKKMIDYNPTTSLYDGLKETWTWFVDNVDEYKNKKNYFTS